MSTDAHATDPIVNPIQPQFHSPYPPTGEPPATSLATTQPPTQTTQAEPSVSSHAYNEVPGTSTAQTLAGGTPQPPNDNPFSDISKAAATAQPNTLQAPPQHPDRPLPVGVLTETPLHSEPAPILPPRPQAQPQFQVPPPPRASFDEPIPDHPAMRQSSLERAQSPAQSNQRVTMTPAQPQPVPPPPQAPVLDSNADVLGSDPAIASLHAMFPDFDLLVLQSVLEATGGDKDQAVDSLLAMSDPEYAQSQSQTTAGAGAGNQGRPPTQTELDEEFARRLMLEEEQQANAGAWQPANAQYNQSVPYQPYQRRSGEYQRHQNAGPGGGTGFGEMAGGLHQQFRNFIGGSTARTGAGTQPQSGTGNGYQDQFSKIADTGKKTFNTIFNKVKQKMEEFDGKHPPDTQHMNQPPQSGHWSNWQAPAPGQQQHVPTYTQSPAGQYVTSVQSPPPPVQHGALNTNPYDLPAASSTSGNANASSALPRSSGRWQYEPEQPETLPPPPPQSQLPASGAPATGSTEEPRRSIDATRLGLLPKRPVSLMDVNANTRAAQPPTATHAQDSDDDSLEYVDRPMPGAMTRT